MFRKIRLVVVLGILPLILFVAAPVLATHECEGNWWWADEAVIWCAHTDADWQHWNHFDAKSDLADIVEQYGWEADELYGMGDLEMVALTAYPAVDQHAVYAQLFSLGFDFSEYSSDEEVIADVSLDDGAIEFELTESSTGESVGLASVDYGEASRSWVVYPFEELGKIYIVAAYAPDSVWDRDNQLRQHLTDTMYTVQVYFEEGQSSSSAATQADYPVWLGGEVTQIYSESGNGDVRTVFEDAQWEFFPDGTVTFTPTGIGENVRADLFPTSGTYTTSNADIMFDDGVYSISGGTISFVLEGTGDMNLSSVLITGDLDLDTGVAVIEYMVQSSMVDTLNDVSMLLTYEASFAQEFYQ